MIGTTTSQDALYKYLKIALWKHFKHKVLLCKIKINPDYN